MSLLGMRDQAGVLAFPQFYGPCPRAFPCAAYDFAVTRTQGKRKKEKPTKFSQTHIDPRTGTAWGEGLLCIGYINDAGRVYQIYPSEVGYNDGLGNATGGAVYPLLIKTEDLDGGLAGVVCIASDGTNDVNDDACAGDGVAT